MKVPISGRVKTSSMASMARRMSVAFFLLEPKAGREDEVDRRFGQRDDVLRVPAPVGVGPLDRDLALDDVAVEEGPKLFGQVLLDAQGDVVEVDQQGGVRGVHWRLAQVPRGPNQRSVHVALVPGPPVPRGPLDAPGRTRKAAGQRGERDTGRAHQGSSLGSHSGGTVGHKLCARDRPGRRGARAKSFRKWPARKIYPGPWDAGSGQVLSRTEARRPGEGRGRRRNGCP